MNKISIDKLREIIPISTIEAVKKPIAEATGMPNAVYRDPELFAFERENVMGKTWAAIAFSSELPKNGYAKPVDFMGLPIAIMRNKEGKVNVFHNVCSHRGMPLIKEEVEVVGMLRCPYHSWTYDLNGTLKGTPHIGGVGQHSAEGFACEKHGLKSIRSHVWMDMIFVNLSGEAENFDKFVAPLTARWEEFTGKGGLNEVFKAATGSNMELEVQSNWKLAVENYCEAYHLPWVHPSLNSYSPLDQHYNLIVDENSSGQGTYTYNLADVAGIALPKFEQWPEDKIRRGEYISLYPNVLLGIQADHLFTIILQPLAQNKTLEKLQISYVSKDSIGDSYEACRQGVLDAWKVVFSEDVFAVEGMQEGRISPAFKGGVFSPVLDGPTHHFHQWVADKYAEELT